MLAKTREKRFLFNFKKNGWMNLSKSFDVLNQTSDVLALCTLCFAIECYLCCQLFQMVNIVDLTQTLIFFNKTYSLHLCGIGHLIDYMIAVYMFCFVYLFFWIDLDGQ